MARFKFQVVFLVLFLSVVCGALSSLFEENPLGVVSAVGGHVLSVGDGVGKGEGGIWQRRRRSSSSRRGDGDACAGVGEQCGGDKWDGVTCCVAGSECVYKKKKLSECESLPCTGGWMQCGGHEWSGATCCESGYSCVWQSEWYSQCRPVVVGGGGGGGGDGPACSGAWMQCGGEHWSGSTCCVSGYSCVLSDAWYSQCRPGGDDDGDSDDGDSDDDDDDSVDDDDDSVDDDVEDEDGSGNDLHHGHAISLVLFRGEFFCLFSVCFYYLFLLFDEYVIYFVLTAPNKDMEKLVAFLQSLHDDANGIVVGDDVFGGGG